MAVPYEYTLFEGVSGASSFTAKIPTLNYQMGSIHVIYSSMSTDTGTISVQATNDPVARTAPANASWATLLPSMTTLTSACTGKLFKITNTDYAFAQVVYAANSNTSGTLSAYVVLKGYD